MKQTKQKIYNKLVNAKKKYRIEMDEIEHGYVEVEARNQQEAEEKAYEKWCDGSGHYGSSEQKIVEVTRLDG